MPGLRSIVRRAAALVRPAGPAPGSASRPAAPSVGAGFDPDFYQGFYTDLAVLGADPARLEAHYRDFGRAEGRFGDEAAYYADLQGRRGSLPSGFDAQEYWRLHADLRDALTTRWQAAEHWLAQGRDENRAWYGFDADLYRRLYFPDAAITDGELAAHYRETGRAEGRHATWRAYLAGQGAPAGAWLDRLKVDEFALLNGDWTGPVTDKLAAVRLLLEHGPARLAALAFDTRFELAYQREVHPERATDDDAALYRAWLFDGLERREPGSAEEHLRRAGLNVGAYPAAFDWAAYARRHRLGVVGRWAALDHLVRGGAETLADAPIAGAEAGLLYAALGAQRAAAGDDEGAVLALTRARAAGAESVAVLQGLGEALARQGLAREALAAFQAATRDPGAGVGAYAGGADAAIALEAFRAAVELLESGREAVSGEPRWRAAVERTIEAWFRARSRRARTLYRSPLGRARADAALAAQVARVGELWERLDPVGAPLPGFPARKVVVLANFDLPACIHYRVDQKAQQLDALGRDYAIYRLDEWREFLADLPGAGAAIVFRLPAWPAVVRALQAARALGVPTYYDIDDLIFDPAAYPDTLESYGGLVTAEEYAGLQFGVPLIRAAIGLCDYAIAPTSSLARAMAPLVREGRAFVVPNGLDASNEPYLDAPPTRVRRDGGVLVAYASGTKAHNGDFDELAAQALADLLARRPAVRFLLIGHLALHPAFEPVRSQVIRCEPIADMRRFWSLLAEADLSLAVLKPTAATDAKSEIKWLEAAAMGMPSIVSDTATYREVLQDGVDALIARTPAEWAAALERMVDDADLRVRVGAAARAKAADRYGLAVIAERLAEALAPADARRPVPPAARPRARPLDRPRILLCNVFFPPQTIGGATRVLRNNLDDWLDAGLGERFAFAVVATDHDAAPPHRLRVDAYRGVPVFRISAPVAAGMDWRPLDPAMGAVFADVLAAWRPDLVHMHAIQRLTASIVEACRWAGVPYLVTVHDAWWVSDHLFLVDDEGRPVAPGEDLPRSLPAGVSLPEALDRRRVLRDALGHAQAVLGVSESFAALYRACGFERAIAVPNGLPPMRRLPRTVSASGRVRLAHIGNTSRHKGFHLVQAALLRGAYANLELTVIDHARPPGSEARLTWGATPVRMIGKLPQERIEGLYVSTDVLLAPSIWPESFGLVTREALAAGCWVVAGDVGAIGEDVLQGVNGLVVDVSGVEGLAAALAGIDADPERFLQSPPPVTLRPAAAQATELINIYRDMLAAPLLAPAPQAVAADRPEAAFAAAASLSPAGPTAPGRSAAGRLQSRRRPSRDAPREDS